jgi:beta-glucosidase
VVSDCWAICDFHEHHNVTSTPQESAAMALKNGCDLNCGRAFQYIMIAYDIGLVSEEEITQSVIRLMTTRMKLGLFDRECAYHSIPYSEVESAEHIALSEEASVKSMVLLKNDGLLPLKKETLRSVAVIGPTANSREVLKGNYNGTSSRYCTILEGIQQALPDDTHIYYSEGCHLFKNQIEPLAQSGDRLAEAKAVAEKSDVVILCLGLDATMEGEEGDTGNAYAAGDKPDLSLPKPQKKLLQAVLSAGKPTVLVLSTGSAVDLQEADVQCNAILETWYCGARGGSAAAKLLFGEEVPSGKQPVTFYKNIDGLPDFVDYSMKGRTYRFLESEPLYPFGFGLSYADIFYENLNSSCSTVNDGENVELRFTVRNKSAFVCEEVAEIYIKTEGSTLAVPNWSLCGFRRIALQAGEVKQVSITVDRKAFQVVNEDGEYIYGGTSYMIFVGGSQPDSVSAMRMGRSPLSIQLKREPINN